MVFLLIKLPALLALAVVEGVHVALMVAAFTCFIDAGPEADLVTVADPGADVARFPDRIVPGPGETAAQAAIGPRNCWTIWSTDANDEPIVALVHLLLPTHNLFLSI